MVEQSESGSLLLLFCDHIFLRSPRREALGILIGREKMVTFSLTRPSIKINLISD